MPGDTPPLEGDLLKRAQEAQVAKVEADALEAKAKADKAVADARGAEAELAEDARVADAVRREKIAKADQAAAAARREQLSALLPDLSKVKDSVLTRKDGPPIAGVPLTFGALKKVAEAIARCITDALGVGSTSARVLLTADADLATADGVYRDVSTGIMELEAAADRLLSPPTARAAVVAPAMVEATIGVLAGAVPAVLSLLSGQRTLSTAPVTLSDLAATAAVAGALRSKAGPGMALVHQDFRLVPDTGVYAAAARLQAKRQELGAAKARAEAEPAPGAAAQARIGQLAGLCAAIDTFTAAIRAVPEGARRSALATAALCEQLHHDGAAGGAGRFSHVVLVKGQEGQSQELVDNRPLWFKDRFSTTVDVSVTYLLLECGGSTILAAGTETATATAYGQVGEAAKINFIKPGEGKP